MPGISSITTMIGQVRNFLTTSPYGFIVILLIAVLVFLLVILPLIGKVRRKRIKSKETGDIMKDLLTWRHLAQLVKGGDEHNKAKEELSDNIVRINELLKQGFVHATRQIQNLYSTPWYVVLGEPRSGKSSLLAASDLEMVPSAEEDNPQEDPKNSLPVRFWTGAKAVVCDISGKVFFDRWLNDSSAEWNYITRQICRKRRRRVLDGIIITIPADALLADNDNLSSKKAILMANELGQLLQQSGMRLPCYVVVTKLDMVSGFQEYAKAFTGDLRHQILGFENDSNFFIEDTFKKFWNTLYERLHSGSRQLLFPGLMDGEGSQNSRMDMAGKIWLFPDNVAALYKNLRTYLDILFGEDNFHGTKNTFFEGVYFSSAKDLGFSFSPDIAALAGRNTDDMPIPVTMPDAAGSAAAADAPGRQIALNANSPSTALVAVNAVRTLIAPYLQRQSLLRGYFIRNLLHRKVFVPSPNAGFVRKEAIRRHIPHYVLCAAMVSLGALWLGSALFKAADLRVSLINPESYYQWLDSALQKGGPFKSPLIKEDGIRNFTLDNSPVEGEALSSRLQFYYNSLIYRDLKVASPLGFRFSEALVFRFDRNMGYREKAFIANQLHKSMVRIPVIKNVGAALVEDVDTQVLDGAARDVIASFVSLDKVEGVDFYKFFAGPRFKLDAMIRYLMPDISNDTMQLLANYKPKYDSLEALQMDVDYIYSDNYRTAKQAGLDTMLSAWRRREVYPESIYGKIRLLAAISEGITVNYTAIIDALNRINNVSSLSGVEDAVYEWKRLTDRQKSLAAQGRSTFEEVRLLMRAAHIPLGFDTASTDAAQRSGVAGLLKRPVLDAFGNNLINDYLFNDMVIGYAVREYTRLFDADMEFIRKETGTRSTSTLGAIIAEQNAFSSDLNREVDDLRGRAQVLQNNELLSQKIADKPDSPSLFMTAERILQLASDIPIPRGETLRNVTFETSWQRGQNNIKAALDAFEVYVKPYLENEKLSVVIANARVMLLAEAYYNRYTIFTTTLSYLNTFEGNIAAVIESKSNSGDLFSFSGNTIESLFGGFYSNKGYDPLQVKAIIDDVASFAALFKPGEDAKSLPLFLQNVDKQIYQPPAFMDYLASYISYWGNYPDRVYVSAGTWERFCARAAEYKSFQINSVLLSVYVKCQEWLSQIDDSLLNESLLALKSTYSGSLGDKLSLLNQFLSADTERMFLAWTALPSDPMEAYGILRTASEEDLKISYLAVYTAGDTVGIGWWNSFVLDGITVLARHVDAVNMAHLIENMDTYKAYPLCSDAPPDGALSLNTVKEIARLLGDMGAALEEQDTDPVTVLLHHSLFKGSAVQNWARTVHRISAAVANAGKPLAWTLIQAPVEVQSKITGRGRLLAIDRFRYVEVSSAGNNPRMSSTYMNDKQTLLEGSPEDESITFTFYLTSRDRSPGAAAAFTKQWSVFDLYLQKEYVADDQGNRYIPVYLEDAAGTYVYYIGLEFNAEVPASASWYSSRNWPDMAIADGMIVERP